MTPSSPKLYDELNQAWKSACRIMLGDEIGELSDYKRWLKGYAHTPNTRKSYLSGEDVAVAVGEYCKEARFVSADEIGYSDLSLDINDIKDIDSLLQAVSERLVYSGNKILGKSQAVESSDQVIDSSYVYDSSDVRQSSKIVYSFNASKTNFGFGSAFTENCEFAVRNIDLINGKRCFESHICQDISDSYFCYNCKGCHDILFSFHQTNKKYVIGNLQLPKEKYIGLKRKLLEEMKWELERYKQLFSIFGIAEEEYSGPKVSAPAKRYEENMKVIDGAFASTFRMIFKRDPGRISDYKTWLSRNTLTLEEVDTVFGSKTYLPHRPEFEHYLKLIPRNRMVTYDETSELGKLHLDENEIDSVEGIKRGIGKISLFSLAAILGENYNLINTPSAFNVSNIYDGYAVIFSEYIGESAGLANSKYVFGSYGLKDSMFCIDCYSSLKLNRCFELDNCTNCSDSLFCYNSENVQDSMFCFNAKSRRHTIGNAQLDPTTYKKLKDALVEQMADEIIREKSFKYDIFNIGYIGEKARQNCVRA